MKGRDPQERPAVLLLDGATFPKIMPHQNLSTVLMIAHRQDGGDYGIISMKEDYWAFAEQAEYSGSADFVRFAQIVIETPAEEGSTASETVALAYKIDKGFFDRQHPRIYLFQPGSTVPDMYPQYSSINVIALSRWLSQKTKFYMPISGTINAFYWLARKYMVDAKEEEHVHDIKIFRENIFKETEDMIVVLRRETKDENLVELANYYLKTMERVTERGDNYIFDI